MSFIETKKASQSVTILSAIGVLIATAINGLFGGGSTTSAELIDILTTITQLVGSIAVIFGRIRAKKAIK